MRLYDKKVGEGGGDSTAFILTDISDFFQELKGIFCV